MKIYVDEMPKSCNSCPFQDYETNTCGCDKSINCCWQNDRKAKNCPLHSITDHDKQVRKEVVEKFKGKINKYAYQMCCLEQPTTLKYGVFVKDIISVLDQIEKENDNG